ncbi:MAG: DUF5036 family protein [Muribaculaceae bacterium]|nr:DUF5036 family protein [Muribaculaceae bacterium]
MKRIIYYLFVTLFATLSSAALISCGGDEPNNPDNGDPIKPDATVPDPTGTIELSMRNANNGRTWLGNIYIGSDDNFTGINCYIASLGPVKGLGNVSSIPVAGWAREVAVTPGNGYVVYDASNDEFYRIYVIDYIISTTGGVIGADVKYQKPFKGLDETIRVKENKVVLPAEGGAQQIVFENSSVIPFKVSSSEGWCKVQKASTRDQSFLYDAIVISCDESFAAEDTKATVTIETLYGKQKTIEVTRAARGEFITLSQENIQVNFSTSSSTNTVNVFTNIEPSDIKISSSDDWLTGDFSGSAYSTNRKVRWIENVPVTRATLDNPVSQTLLINTDGYAGAEEREGSITLSYNTTKCVLKVKQQGSNFKITQTDFVFEGDENLTQTVSWSGNMHYSDLKANVDTENSYWISVGISTNDLTLALQPNPYPDTRSATIELTYKNMLVAKLNVIQKGSVITDKYVYFESSASNYTLSFPVKQDAKITSSADWCSATPNAASLVVRATATTEDRNAVITVEGVDAKIYVSQSKYKVNDKYKVGDINATVYSMTNGVGKIKYELTGTYAWSTEMVDISGLSMDDGIKNMEIIKAIPGWKELYPAFAAVDALNIDGVTGWYLPAYAELSGYYGTPSYKWTSTQHNYSTAYSQYGNNYKIDLKSQKKDVVAMKTFSYDFSKK